MKKQFSVFFVIILLLLAVSFCLVSCDGYTSDSDKQPGTSRIKNDLRENASILEISTSLNRYGYEIDSITIDLGDYNEQYKEWSGELIVALSNSMYRVDRKCSVEYKRYDTGGWRCEKIKSGSYTVTAVLREPKPTEIAEELRDYRALNVQTTNADTGSSDYENWNAEYSFTSSYCGKCLSYTEDLTVNAYVANNLQWQLSDPVSKHVKYNMEDLSGLWYQAWGSHNTETVYHVDSYNENTVDITILEYSLGNYGASYFNDYQISFGIDNVSIKGNDICLELYAKNNNNLTSSFEIHSDYVGWEHWGESRLIMIDDYRDIWWLTSEKSGFEAYCKKWINDILENVDNPQAPLLSSKDLTVGSIVQFGNYEQDNILTNGAELIEWIVLDVNNGKALLLSKNVLDSYFFLNERVPDNATWENSNIRKWLNESFYLNAFNETERKRINNSNIDSKVITFAETSTPPYIEGNKQTFARTGESTLSTSDKVFLLSCEEIDKYLTGTNRLGDPTDSLKASNSMRGTIANGNVSHPYYCWMTRDVVECNFKGYYTYSKHPIFVWGATGDLNNYLQWDRDYSFEADIYCGVRPAIYLSLDNIYK